MTDTENSGSEQSYEVVIRPEGGLDQEHAELMRKRLIDDGFHDHVVSVRAASEGSADVSVRGEPACRCHCDGPHGSGEWCSNCECLRSLVPGGDDE